MKNFLTLLLTFSLLTFAVGCKSGGQEEAKKQETTNTEAKQELKTQESDDVYNINLDNAVKELDLVE